MEQASIKVGVSQAAKELELAADAQDAKGAEGWSREALVLLSSLNIPVGAGSLQLLDNKKHNQSHGDKIRSGTQVHPKTAQPDVWATELPQPRGKAEL